MPNAEGQNHPARPSTGPRDALGIVLIYAVFAGIWILFSDMTLGWLIGDPAQLALAGALKGIAFIAVTSLLLYRMLRDGAPAQRRQARARCWIARGCLSPHSPLCSSH